MTNIKRNNELIIDQQYTLFDTYRLNNEWLF